MKLTDLQKRFLLFLIGCIGLRTLFIYFALYIPEPYLHVFTLILFIIGSGFATIWLFGLRKTGRETFGQKIWWNHLRPIHSALYLFAAYSLFNKNRLNAAYALTADVSIGLLSFLHFHLFQ